MKSRAWCVAGLAAIGVASVAGAQAPMLTLSASGCPARIPSAVSSGALQDSASALTDTSRAIASSPASHPDILLLVGVSADEVTFHSQPNASVRLCWGSDSLHIVERRNLPSPVVAGTTYRNVFIAAELRAFFDAECIAKSIGVSGDSTAAANAAGCAAIGLTTARSQPTTASRPPP